MTSCHRQSSSWQAVNIINVKSCVQKNIMHQYHHGQDGQFPLSPQPVGWVDTLPVLGTIGNSVSSAVNLVSFMVTGGKNTNMYIVILQCSKPDPTRVSLGFPWAHLLPTLALTGGICSPKKWTLKIPGHTYLSLSIFLNSWLLGNFLYCAELVLSAFVNCLC